MLNALNYKMVEQTLCMSDQSLKEESSIYKYDLLNYGREHVDIHFSEILFLYFAYCLTNSDVSLSWKITIRNATLHLKLTFASFWIRENSNIMVLSELFYYSTVVCLNMTNSPGNTLSSFVGTDRHSDSHIMEVICTNEG